MNTKFFIDKKFIVKYNKRKNDYFLEMKNSKKYITYEEFLELCDEDTLAEWVDGEIEYYSPASSKHQDLVWFLSSLIGMYAQMKNIGVIKIGPFQMRLKKIKRGREPDILFVSTKNSARLNTTYLDGPADLVIEIISEESRMRDKKIKFEEYEEGGVKEFWLIDPYDKIVNFYALQKGKYKKIKPKEDIYYSKTIKGFWLNVNWLFQEPLPSIIDILREYGII